MALCGLLALAVQCSDLFLTSCCRTAFEEMVMDNGVLRWRRLEDLLDQSSRSLDYDPSQLWLIAGQPHCRGRAVFPIASHHLTGQLRGKSQQQQMLVHMMYCCGADTGA